jgi:hypothetical protein
VEYKIERPKYRLHISKITLYLSRITASSHPQEKKSGKKKNRLRKYLTKYSTTTGQAFAFHTYPHQLHLTGSLTEGEGITRPSRKAEGEAWVKNMWVLRSSSGRRWSGFRQHNAPRYGAAARPTPTWESSPRGPGAAPGKVERIGDGRIGAESDPHHIHWPWRGSAGELVEGKPSHPDRRGALQWGRLPRATPSSICSPSHLHNGSAAVIPSPSRVRAGVAP